MTDVRGLWTRVERWVDAEPILPSPEAMFGPPASVAEIEVAEQALGRSFSESFRASLLVHDGQLIPRVDRQFDDEVAYVPWLPNQMVLLPLHDIVACWRDERGHEIEFDVDGAEEEAGEFDRVREFPTVTHAGRLPIAEGITSYMYLDFVPGPAGDPGQVIFPRDECEFVVAGKDFADFLARYIDLLERGALRYEADEYHTVIPADPYATFEGLLKL